MKKFLKPLLTIAARLFIVGWAIRNVLGLIAVIPIFAKMIELGGAPMAVWLAFCSVVGLALNILIPAFAYAKLKKALAS